MTKNAKRVDELEVGDIVVTPYEEGNLTISCIEHLGRKQYRILFQELDEVRFFDAVVEVTYLGNNKEEKIMSEMNKARQTQKVDCSVLHSYLDALADREPELHILDVPSYLKKELKNIYELFEGVLDVTLGEVKTLYFERKMSKSRESARTKKVKDLCIGDRILFSLSYDGYEGEETITKLQESSDAQIRIVTEQGTEAIFRKDKVVTLVG